jgi:hypothetical protein
MRRFNASLLAKVQEVNAQWPWASKREELFGRFSPYGRMVHKGLPGLERKGAG